MAKSTYTKSLTAPKLKRNVLFKSHDILNGVIIFNIVKFNLPLQNHIQNKIKINKKKVFLLFCLLKLFIVLVY